ncbi:MAG TPA: hypothetical protein PKA63_07765 [Oligoflexia bacterium]|nr:hypothetical protein [Oligoflexia bacterium]HMP48546.1 hypothetical protein [Oligoflexia bacterium]
MPDPKIELRFLSGKSPELDAVIFTPGDSGEKWHSVRGKTFSATMASNTFNWTSSVKAMAICLVRVVIGNLKSDGKLTTIIGLQGEGKTPAASFDYALARQSPWLLNMFGIDQKGGCRARSIFERNNPERKRPGPVTIYVTSKNLPYSNIDVYLDDIKVSAPGALQCLAEMLEHGRISKKKFINNKIIRVDKIQYKTTKRAFANDEMEILQVDNSHPPPFDDECYQKLLFGMVYHELSAVLKTRHIFRQGSSQSTLLELAHDPIFKYYTGNSDKFFTINGGYIGASENLGMSSKAIQKELDKAFCGEVIINLPASCIGSLSLIFYLERICGFPIRANYSYVHAGEILQKMRQYSLHPGELFILGTGHLSQLLCETISRNYTAVMSMPDISFQIVSKCREQSNPKQSDSLKSGDHLVLGDGVSSSLQYYRELLKDGRVSKGNSKLTFAAPHEITSYFLSGEKNVKAIQWFPYYNFNQLFNGCELELDFDDDKRYRRNVLVGSLALSSNNSGVRALEAAIRDAWLTLIRNPKILIRAIREIINDSKYVKFLSTSGGLHLMEKDNYHLYQIKNFKSPYKKHVASFTSYNS